MEEKTRDFKENSQIKQYSEELDNDLKLTISNIREKSLCVSAYRSKWLKYLYIEKENLSKLTRAKEKVLKTKITNPSANKSLLQMKSEDKLQENDETLIKINTLTKIVKENIDYLERVQNIMADFGYTIRNAIDTFKLEQI